MEIRLDANYGWTGRCHASEPRVRLFNTSADGWKEPWCCGVWSDPVVTRARVSASLIIALTRLLVHPDDACAVRAPLTLRADMTFCISCPRSLCLDQMWKMAGSPPSRAGRPLIVGHPPQPHPPRHGTPSRQMPKTRGTSRATRSLTSTSVPRSADGWRL